MLRVDFNVPLTKGRAGKGDDLRIRASLPTIRYLIKKRAKVILISHLGRPEIGKWHGADGKWQKDYSLRPVAGHLEKLLQEKVHFINYPFEKSVKILNRLKAGELAMLENIRFYLEEKKNDPKFAQWLAGLGDIYVNDAFGDSHRAHASIAGLPKFLPSYAGFLLDNEVKHLSRVWHYPRPRVLIMGGAKVETKLGLIKKILPKVDYVLIGGLLTHYFFKARGQKIIRTKLDQKLVKSAAKLKSKKIILPSDAGTDRSGVIYDIGRKTIKLYLSYLKKAGTIVWNGPLGMVEEPKFAKGTIALARAAGRSKAKTIVGGGDLIKIFEKLGLTKKVTFVSTGGGAMLEFLRDGTLVGLKSLK